MFFILSLLTILFQILNIFTHFISLLFYYCDGILKLSIMVIELALFSYDLFSLFLYVLMIYFGVFNL